MLKQLSILIKGTCYDTYDAAYEVCKNYRSSGTYYNDKCYNLS